MKLVGSIGSPYVRKIRLILDQYNFEYDFEVFNSHLSSEQEAIESYSSLKRIPILIDEQEHIFDSSLICEYLLNKKNIHLSIKDKLHLKLIDELCDSCVTLIQQKMWGIDEQWQNLRSQKMLRRVELILNELEEKKDTLTDLQLDWLFCALDWINLRGILDWSVGRSKLKEFYRANEMNTKYESTNPRNI